MEFEALYPGKTHNMKEAWMLGVILAINLKSGKLNYKWVVDHKNMSAETLSGHSFRVKKNLQTNVLLILNCV